MKCEGNFEWYPKPGVTERFTVSECDSMAEAIDGLLELVARSKYRPPRWWEWWRWREDRLPRKTGGESHDSGAH